MQGLIGRLSSGSTADVIVTPNASSAEIAESSEGSPAIRLQGPGKGPTACRTPCFRTRRASGYMAMHSESFPVSLPHDSQPGSDGWLPVADLDSAERLVVHAIRAGGRLASPGRAGIAVADHERAKMHELLAAIERYLEPRPRGSAECVIDPTAARLGAFELHTLHALACLQAGLLGEAWKSLVRVWAHDEAGKALVRLQDVAEVLQLSGRRIQRWQFDPAFFRAAALL